MWLIIGTLIVILVVIIFLIVWKKNALVGEWKEDTNNLSSCKDDSGNVVVCGGSASHREVNYKCVEKGKDITLDAKYCIDPKPISFVPCDLRKCVWQKTSESECSKPCGEGTKTISYSCETGNDADCNASEKPSTSEACKIRECDGSWIFSNWTTKCVDGIVNRSVVCSVPNTCDENNAKPMIMCSEQMDVSGVVYATLPPINRESVVPFSKSLGQQPYYYYIFRKSSGEMLDADIISILVNYEMDSNYNQKMYKVVVVPTGDIMSQSYIAPEICTFSFYIDDENNLKTMYSKFTDEKLVDTYQPDPRYFCSVKDVVLNSDKSKVVGFTLSILIRTYPYVAGDKSKVVVDFPVSFE